MNEHDITDERLAEFAKLHDQIVNNKGSSINAVERKMNVLGDMLINAFPAMRDELTRRRATDTVASASSRLTCELAGGEDGEVGSE